MAKLIANQVKTGEGKLYHEKILETYIIVIGKENMFAGNTKLKDQTLFEIDAKVMIEQTNEMYPGNKMFWKFFELPKFRQSQNYEHISKESSLKGQWLEFLVDCTKQSTEPDREEIIKKGYKIMEVDSIAQILRWKAKAQAEDAKETLAELKEEVRKEGIEQGIKQGIKQGIEQARKEHIKGELHIMKQLFKHGMTEDQVKTILPILSKLTSDVFHQCWEQVDANDSNEGYEDLCKALDLVGKCYSATEDISIDDNI